MADNNDCSSADCAQSFLGHAPSLAGNVALLILFAVLIPVAFVLGIKFKSSIYTTTVISGLALEVVGYIGRVLLHGDPTNKADFVVYFLCTVTAPTLLAAALYLIFPRIVSTYGQRFRTWTPVWYNLVFVTLTAVSFILELVGAVLATIPTNTDMIYIGQQVAIAGLAIQSVSLVLFTGLGFGFGLSVRTRRHSLESSNASLYNSLRFKLFLGGLSVVVPLLLLRTIYRIMPVSEGLSSGLAQNETLFLVLDGVMVLLASTLLVSCTPGIVFGAKWTETVDPRATWKPQRPPRSAHMPLQPPKSTYSPGYTPSYARVSPGATSTMASSPKHQYSPKSSPGYQQATPKEKRNMVDSEALW